MEQYIVDNESGEFLAPVKKSNSLINSLGRSTLLGSKVLLAALVTVEDRDGHVTTKKEAEYFEKLKSKTKVDYTKGLVAEFTDASLRRILKTKSGSYYSSIKNLLNTNDIDSFRYQWGIDIKDPKTGLYGFTELIAGCIYDEQNNRLFIKFSGEDEVRKEIIDLKSQYSLINVSIAMKYKSIYSYRIWELMLSKIGYQDGITHNPQDYYSFNFDLSHLKYLLGILDIRKPGVSEELQRKNPNFARIEELSGQTCMPRYVDFKRYCLDKAKKEIDELTEYTFDFNPVRSGRGGKVVSVDLIFTRKNTKSSPKKAVSDDVDMDEVIEQTLDLFDGLIKYKDVKAICIAAEFDFDKIKKAYDVMNSTPHVDNVVGFMIKAINGNWSSVSKDKSSNKFNDFPQNEYDFDDIEKRFIAN